MAAEGVSADSIHGVGPCQVWSWDITWLPSVVRGRWYYLYMILDLYSRKITGYEVHEVESEHAAALLQRSVIREGCMQITG